MTKATRVVGMRARTTRDASRINYTSYLGRQRLFPDIPPTPVEAASNPDFLSTVMAGTVLGKRNRVESDCESIPPSPPVSC